MQIHTQVPNSSDSETKLEGMLTKVNLNQNLIKEFARRVKEIYQQDYQQQTLAINIKQGQQRLQQLCLQLDQALGSQQFVENVKQISILNQSQQLKEISDLNLGCQRAIQLNQNRQSTRQQFLRQYLITKSEKNILQIDNKYKFIRNNYDPSLYLPPAKKQTININQFIDRQKHFLSQKNSRIQQKIKQYNKQIQDQITTKPLISNGTKKMRSLLNQQPIHKRAQKIIAKKKQWLKYQLNQKNKKLQQQQQKQLQSFTPKQKKKKIKSDLTDFSLWNRRKQQGLKLLKQKIQTRLKQECTFKPQLNQKSKKINFRKKAQTIKFQPKLQQIKFLIQQQTEDSKILMSVTPSIQFIQELMNQQ